MKLSLGPVQYFWSAKKVYDFYEQVKNWPVDIVYLGENVCAKRRELTFDDWLDIAKYLTDAGKQVILSTMVLIEADSELSYLKKICENQSYPVEANDISAVYILKELRNFVAGPHINMYNAETIKLLYNLGACRWVMPMELSASKLKEVMKNKPDDLETEVFAFGHIPLSFSARCFTARKHNVEKDQCNCLCRQDEQGVTLYTQENNKLFNINGIQLQSAIPCNLIAEVEQMRALNVDIIRVSPQADNMEKVVNMFHKAIEKTISQTEVESLLNTGVNNNEWCNGYWHGQPGMNWYQEFNQRANL